MHSQGNNSSSLLIVSSEYDPWATATGPGARGGHAGPDPPTGGMGGDGRSAVGANTSTPSSRFPLAMHNIDAVAGASAIAEGDQGSAGGRAGLHAWPFPSPLQPATITGITKTIEAAPHNGLAYDLKVIDEYLALLRPSLGNDPVPHRRVESKETDALAQPGMPHGSLEAYLPWSGEVKMTFRWGWGWECGDKDGVKGSLSHVMQVNDVSASWTPRPRIRKFGPVWTGPWLP